jgi:molecular chaperone HtpG
MSLNLERLMKAHGQATAFDSTRILEINQRHPIIRQLAEKVALDDKSDVVADGIQVLFDQALIAAGEPIRDPAGFAERIERFLSVGLNS